MQLSREKDFAPRAHVSGRELIELIALSEAEWDEFSRGSAVRRAGYAGFKRSVAVALGNWGSRDAVPVLTRALSDPEPLVRAHAAWALGRLRSAEASAALVQSLPAEKNDMVREEILCALESEPLPFDGGRTTTE